MEKPIETIEKDKIIIEVYSDDDPMNPRKEWDNLGHMVCFHKRYDLGDEHDMSIEELQEIVNRDDVIALPLYLLDHSGITMSTHSFGDPWDSGKVGYIYVTNAEACKEYGWSRMTPKRESIIKRHLEMEVNTYDDYLTGNVYGFITKCKNCGEEIDSCWGFFGDYHTNGVLDEAENAECEDCKETEKRLQSICDG